MIDILSDRNAFVHDELSDMRKKAEGTSKYRDINTVYQIYVKLRYCYKVLLNDDMKRQFLYDNAFLLSYVYIILSIPMDDDFKRRAKNYGKKVESVVPVVSVVEEKKKMTFNQFKKERQRMFPRKLGYKLQKGELSHKLAYEEYLKNGRILR